MASVALSPLPAASRAFSGTIKAATRHVRWTVLISLLLIFGSFVSAAVIQMRRDRIHALDQAAFMETRRAQEIAADLGPTLDRYADLGSAFANAQESVETSAALSDAGGPALQNIAVLDGAGRLLSEMKRPPGDLLPLAPALLDRATTHRVVFLADRGNSFVLAVPDGGRVILVQLSMLELFPRASMEDDLLATPDGQILAIGRNWRDFPSATALTQPTTQAETRILDMPAGRRLIALARIPNWPVTAGASVRVGEALSGWYGALPLYFFFILGPAFAGAGLAVVLVREFERRTRPTSADRLLKAKRRDEARLLIRLADAERRAAEATRSKAEFITHMSHELRTPLNAIIGFSEVIERGLFGRAGHPKYEEYAHDINEAGRKLHTRIDEILEFANLETGKQAITLAPLDATQIVRQAIDELAGKAFSRRIRISTDWAETMPAVADAHALKRAFSNLLANALQYTRDGGLVRVQIRRDSGSVTITIQDNGPGFSAGEAMRAGQPFVHFTRPGVSAGAGLGLGLAIAGSLIRRMGGTLDVTGTPGEGAAVEVRLKAAA